MNAPLTYDEAFALLPELALGTLPADEVAVVLAFVQTSPECQKELASLRGTVAALASAAGSPVPMAAERKSAMRDRLMSRAAPSSAPPSSVTPSSVTPSSVTPSSGASSSAAAANVRPIDSARSQRGRGIPVWMAVAACAAFAITQLTSYRALSSQRDAQRVERETSVAALSKLEAQLQSRDSLVEALTNANVRVVELVSTSNREPGARMFWDRLANRWTLITHDLKTVPSGRTYQLWLVTAKAEKISAGTFNTDARGRAVVQATYALAEADLAAIAITEEPDGGSPQPTGAILVAGAATR
jgi:anti-sigma-K factor RskA